MCSDAQAVCANLLLLMHEMEGAAMRGMKLVHPTFVISTMIALSTKSDLCVHPDNKRGLASRCDRRLHACNICLHRTDKQCRNHKNLRTAE